MNENLGGAESAPLHRIGCDGMGLETACVCLKVFSEWNSHYFCHKNVACIKEETFLNVAVGSFVIITSVIWGTVVIIL